MEREAATLWAAIIAAAAAVSATVVTAVANRSLRRLRERFTRHQESVQFLQDKISRLYVPMAIHLRITKQLFLRYTAGVTTEHEKTLIEHALREFNGTVRETLVAGFHYLEPDAPREATTDLLEHLIQWENVYKLKYESKTYDGAVFAGIAPFGYRGFPQGADQYFVERAEELRELLHARTTLSG